MEKILKKIIQEISFDGFGEKYSETGIRNPIRDVDQVILTMLVKIKKPKKILELGTGYGLSGLCMLRGYKDSQLTTIEFDRSVSAKAEMNFQRAGFSPILLCGDAAKVIKSLGEKYDLIFFDHEKSKFLEHLLEIEKYNLILKETVILAHNVINRQSDCNDFIQYMHKNYFTAIINTECGILVSMPL